MEVLTAALLFAGGIAIGAASALFGIGGAVIAIPMMRIMFGFSGSEAIATALPLTIPVTLASAFKFSKYNLVKYKTALTGGVAGIATAIAGAYFTEFFSSAQLMLAFSALLFALAITTATAKPREKEEKQTLKTKAVSTTAIGALAGFTAGFFGIGGGAILTTLYMKIRRMPVKQAVATSLATIAVFALPGAATHYALGNMNVPALAVLLAGSLTGAWAGANHSLKMNENTQKKLLTLLLATMATIILANELLKLA
ncbi:sulfite exporter TauE/SafE family protein [Candidatus Micrarchaeota archaeon]|nr:sulfite exporter TauE/SafE family protein [Candidatus Micrarchaeota archaeon]